jgi:hypothetical protein
MRLDERQALRKRFQYRCGYCGVSETSAGAELTVDHFKPRSCGGLHEPDNWVYSCHACNEFKGDWWPVDSIRRILHPLRDDLGVHLAEQEDGTLAPLTETGAFHIERLHLNRQQLIAYRRERRFVEAPRQAQARTVERLGELEKEVQDLLAQVQKIERGEPDR